ncbi:MucR family transcriptional regulator [Sagittula marina]|uniref:MucR family transcriptional regulator n=1 Tax=Sagittula marina TaxID=943940 RepID=UPI001607F2EE|nr:MucR family transcriptional regulator [Sagittula marina]
MRINLRQVLNRVLGQHPATGERAVSPDDTCASLRCLETGQRRPLLRRHLRETLGMTAEEYRAKWNLPEDYPMVSRAYADQRKAARSMKRQG